MTRHLLRILVPTIGVLVCALELTGMMQAQTSPAAPVRDLQKPGVVTTNQRMSPAGAQSVFNGRVYGVAFGETTDEIWALVADAGQSGAYRLSWRENRVLDRVPLGRGRLGPQSAVFDPLAKRLLFATAVQNPSYKPGNPDKVTPAPQSSRVQLSAAQEGKPQPVGPMLGDNIAGALAIAGEKNAKGHRIVAVPLIYNNQLAVLDADTGALLFTAPTGIAPFGVALDRQGSVAYVSNWGGRIPASGDLTAPTGRDPDADRVVVDGRGIAATGTVTRIDLTSGQSTHSIETGLHPTAIVADERRRRVYVANGNADSVTVIDSDRQETIQTIAIQPFAERVMGIAPTALALSPDGSRLFVACGGVNAVAVINLPAGRLLGMIPTAWYPSSLAISPDGRRIAVGALLGHGWGQEERTIDYGNGQKPVSRRMNVQHGAVNVVDVPNEADLARYSRAVSENNRLPLAADGAQPRQPRRDIAPTAIPERAGEPSLIEHVVYIIKENHTYDRFFGDLKKGNGDPAFHLYGDRIIPNHRRLADQFVLLDNFYSVGGNSGDGHQWVTQANQTDYPMWPGYVGRSYPFDGSDPIAYSNGGFLWDAAVKAGKSVKVFGEFIPAQSSPNGDRQWRAKLFDEYRQGARFLDRFRAEPHIARLAELIAPNYPPYGPVPDVIRAQIFLDYLARWEHDGQMPNLTIVQLPSDHGMGGGTTYIADIADNDYALGQVVGGLSKSRFWRRMAIFVVEDDPGGGSDHVDGHRTVALAISPYVKRGAVDSTMYSHPSIPKTIELIFGLPNLSLFDLIANDMRASFTDTPDLRPYEAVRPEHPIDERQPKPSALAGRARELALAYSRIDFSQLDGVPAEKLSRLAWEMLKGDQPYPEGRRAVFSPLGIDLTDEEQEERAEQRRKQ